MSNACDMSFDSKNWQTEQTTSLTARLDYKKDKNFVAKLKVTSTLVINGRDTQTVPVCQKYNVSRRKNIEQRKP